MLKSIYEVVILNVSFATDYKMFIIHLFLIEKKLAFNCSVEDIKYEVFGFYFKTYI